MIFEILKSTHRLFEMGGWKKGMRLCLWGGNANNGASSGLVYVNSNNAFSNAHSGIGSRLAYYGNLKFVNGRDI